MQLLGHDRGAGSLRCLGHRAEASAASSSQAACRSTIYDLRERSDAIVVVSAYLPSRHEPVPVDLDERVLVCSLASGATSGNRSSSVTRFVRSHCTTSPRME